MSSERRKNGDADSHVSTMNGGGALHWNAGVKGYEVPGGAPPGPLLRGAPQRGQSRSHEMRAPRQRQRLRRKHAGRKHLEPHHRQHVRLRGKLRLDGAERGRRQREGAGE